jgi:hypothetical protein
MKLPQVEPVVVHCVCHGILLLALKGLYLALNIFMTSQACEWAVLTVLAWCIIDSATLRGCRHDAEAGLVSLIAKCDSSLAAIGHLALRYESIERRCQAANLRHLRARDATLRELNWMAFCRRCILLEHLRVIRCEASTSPRRSASDGNLDLHGSLARTHSLTS